MMKKITLFAISAIVIASSVMSQNQYYYNEGDTIHGRDTIYHYQWWSEQWLASDSMHKLHTNVYAYWFDHFLSNIHGRVVRYCYTEQPLKIVGISTSLYHCYLGDDPLHLINYNHMIPVDSPPERQEYVLLYEADTAYPNFYEVARLPFDYSKPPRYMTLDLRWSQNYCCSTAPDRQQTIPVREFYFDKPITVHDSFYVGHTANTNWWPDPDTIDYAAGVRSWSLLYVPFTTHAFPCTEETMNCDSLPFQLYRAKQDDYVIGEFDSNWHYYRGATFMLDFPIVEIDSSFYDGPPQYVCPPATNLRVAQAQDGMAVLLWNTHADHVGWQVSYGPAGTPPDSGTLVDCPIQVAQLHGLDTCTQYVAYVRGICNHDSTMYSEWSDSVVFNSCGQLGMETPDPGIAQLVTILPNPASSQVQLLSSFELRAVTVYDLQGRTIMEEECSGHNATFSVNGWDDGLYIAVIHTAGGIFSKKLLKK